MIWGTIIQFTTTYTISLEDALMSQIQWASSTWTSLCLVEIVYGRLEYSAWHTMILIIKTGASICVTGIDFSCIQDNNMIKEQYIFIKPVTIITMTHRSKSKDYKIKLMSVPLNSTTSLIRETTHLDFWSICIVFSNVTSNWAANV
jgi:hypothetical protein